MTGSAAVVRTVPVADELTTEDGTVVLVEAGSDHRVLRLSPIGAAVRELCREGRTLDDLTTALRGRFGDPPDDDLATAVATVVRDLSAEGLVEVS